MAALNVFSHIWTLFLSSNLSQTIFGTRTECSGSIL